MEPIQAYRDRLPRHGYGTDEITHGLRVYPIQNLITKALVQHNARHSLAWLVYDLDSPSAMLDWDDNHCPPPNMIALNPENGHAHLYYGLEKPVHNYDGASKKALRYMAAIDIALTQKLGADPGYSKLISKNPTNDRWLTFFPRVDLYDLDELASWLDLKKLKDLRRRVPAVGLGRNCTLFEGLRHWAYRERRKEQAYLSKDMFIEACRWRALAINSEFPQPLPHAEVRATAKSVGKWTWSNMSAQGFRQWQTRQSKKAAAKRTAEAEHLRAMILQTRAQCPELTQADIATLHGVSQQCVSKHLRTQREHLSDMGALYPTEGALSDISRAYSNGAQS